MIETPPWERREMSEETHIHEETIERLLDTIASQRSVLERVYHRMHHLEDKLESLQSYADNADQFQRHIDEVSHTEELIRRLKLENDALRRCQANTVEHSRRIQQLSAENEHLRQRPDLQELEELRNTLKAANSLISRLT